MFLSFWADLYTNQTEAELALEPAVAALGERYRSQHPFFGLGYIVDFALLDRKTVVEVDGNSHVGLKAKIKDLTRTLALLRRGWRTVRIWNQDAISDPPGALSRALSGHENTIPGLEAQLARLQAQVTDTPPRPKTRSSRGAKKVKVTPAP